MPTATKTSARTDHDLLIDAARALAPELARRATESEANRTMLPDLVAQVEAAGLFRLGLPRSLGGWECDPATVISVVETLAQADGSAGWTVLIGNSTAFLAWLDPAVAKDLLASAPSGASTGVFAPSGVAVPGTAGEFVVDGRWPFSSGSVHATLFMAGVHVMDGEQPRMLPPGRPDWRAAWFSPRDADVLDTWDAVGLRGTGSHDVAARAIHVPREHTAAPWFDRAYHDGPLYRLSFFNLCLMFLAGFPAGVARRALDEFASLAPGKTRPGAGRSLADDASVQLEIGIAEGELRAARAFVGEAFGDAWDTVVRGDPCSLEQRARVVIATGTMMRAAVNAVDRAFSLAGSGAVYSDHPLQRCFRDLHTAAQHLAFSQDVLRGASSILLGCDQPVFRL